MNEDVFLVEHVDETLVVTPTSDLSELDFDRIQSSAEKVIRTFDRSSMRNVVLDLSRTTYHGSTALGFFVRLWKRVKTVGGNMVLCGLSHNEKEVLHVTRLDTLWPQRDTRDEALADVSSGNAGLS